MGFGAQLICQKKRKKRAFFCIVLLIYFKHQADVFKQKNEDRKSSYSYCVVEGKTSCVYCVCMSRVSIYQHAVLQFIDHTASLFSGVAISLIFIGMFKRTAATLCTKFPTNLKVTRGSSTLMLPCALASVSLHWPRG